MQTNLYNYNATIKCCPSKPFLKWAGGKTQLLEELENHLPSEIKKLKGKKEIDNYFEPFVGGGAFFFYLSTNYGIKKAYLSDINKDLVLTYNVIKNKLNDLIDMLKNFSNDYLYKSEAKQKEYYYDVRDDFNNAYEDFDYESITQEGTLKAAQFIFLNKTCFNGLYRVNKDGKFNVPFAYSKKPKIYDKKNILDVSKALQIAEIVNASYLESKEMICKNSLVYLDPPYRPLDNKSSFNGYSKLDFDDNCQRELAEYYKEISDKGAYAMLSNSDPKNIDELDNFFDDIYSDYNIHRIDANRFINSKGNKRGPIKEILVTNYDD